MLGRVVGEQGGRGARGNKVTFGGVTMTCEGCIAKNISIVSSSSFSG